MSETTWRQLLRYATERLESASEARWLVERASGFDANDFALGLDEPVSTRAHAFFHAMLDRRAEGEPLQYVVGRWGFRQLDLLVDRRVLIPRPETETVVEVALGELRALGAAPKVVDLGTGSGAIAFSIAVESRDAQVVGTDASPEALAVAQANLSGIGTLAAARVRLVEGPWFAAVPGTWRGRVQLIVSNPPYIGDGEMLEPDVARWEPAGALRAGPTGLEDIATIVAEAPGWLARPGALVVELAPHQAGVVLEMAHDAGFDAAEVRPDLAGRARVLVARVGGS